MYYLVYDPNTGDNIGPFSYYEDAAQFIEYCELQGLSAAASLDIQEMAHPQQFILDNELEVAFA